MEKANNLFGQGDGKFEVTHEQADFSDGAHPNFLKSGDLDEDGFLDVVTFSSSTVVIHKGKGDGTFYKPVCFRRADAGAHRVVSRITIGGISQTSIAMATWIWSTILQEAAAYRFDSDMEMDHSLPHKAGSHTYRHQRLYLLTSIMTDISISHMLQMDSSVQSTLVLVTVWSI